MIDQSDDQDVPGFQPGGLGDIPDTEYYRTSPLPRLPGTEGLHDEPFIGLYAGAMLWSAEEAGAAFDRALQELLRLTTPPPPSLFVRDEEQDWHHLGYTYRDFALGAFPGDPDGIGVLDWPRKHGRKNLAAHTFKTQLTAVLDEVLFTGVSEHVRARQDATVRRLARDLRTTPARARADFDAVQRVLEAAGIGDGYGRLTTPQPVREPIHPPDPREIRIYTGTRTDLIVRRPTRQ